MVDRSEPTGLDEFVGTVESVEYQEPTREDRTPQYHIVMKPTSMEVKGKTGRLHEWIRMTSTTEQGMVPKGSILDYYLTSLERIDKSVKSLKTVDEALKWMVGKSFKFNKESPGKAYKGNPPADYWIPVSKA